LKDAGFVRSVEDSVAAVRVVDAGSVYVSVLSYLHHIP
jgi:hypothetical protein